MYNNNSQQTSKPTGAKFMYINQEFVNNKQKKVLINPNFVHAKPHINMQFLSNQAIHINPNKFKGIQPSQLSNASFLMVSQNSIPSKVNTPAIPSNTKLVRINRPKVVNTKPDQTNFSNTNRINVCDTSKRVVNTKTMLCVNESDRLNAVAIKQKSPDLNILGKPRANYTYDKNKIIVSTRTKLIRQNKINTPLKPTTMKSRFKLIRHTSPKKNTKILLNSRFKIDKRSRRLSKSTNIHPIQTATSLNKKLKSIKLKMKGKEKLLRIRGQNYKLDSNHRTLTLISENCQNVKPNFKTINLGGITFKQKQPNVFVKINLKRTLSNQNQVNVSRSKLKKSNIPCPLYRRFGRCKGKEKGTCIRIHNPDQISLCPRFLQGACIDDKCLLSHKVSLEKMPTCKFFLEGLCTRENCSYLHVKISAKADICKDFLEGFCKKGAECDKRHQLLCPAYEKTNKCPQKNCPYPHGTVVRKSNLSKKCKYALKLHYPNDITKNHPVINDDLSNNNAIGNNETNLDKMISRYYKESNDIDVLVSNVSTVKSNDDQIDLPLKRRRPRVGDLPSYIPFLDEEQNRL